MKNRYQNIVTCLTTYGSVITNLSPSVTFLLFFSARVGIALHRLCEPGLRLFMKPQRSVLAAAGMKFHF